MAIAEHSTYLVLKDGHAIIGFGAATLRAWRGWGSSGVGALCSRCHLLRSVRLIVGWATTLLWVATARLGW
jgi:hypothetical protein